MIRLGLLARKSQLLATFISPSLGFIGLWTNQTEIISLLAGSVSLRYSKQMHSKRIYIFIKSLTSITDWWDFFFFNLPEEINSCCILYISNVDIVSLAMLSEYDLGRGQKDMKIDLSGRSPTHSRQTVNESAGYQSKVSLSDWHSANTLLNVMSGRI